MQNKKTKTSVTRTISVSTELDKALIGVAKKFDDRKFIDTYTRQIKVATALFESNPGLYENLVAQSRAMFG